MTTFSTRARVCGASNNQHGIGKEVKDGSTTITSDPLSSSSTESDKDDDLTGGRVSNGKLKGKTPDFTLSIDDPIPPNTIPVFPEPSLEVFNKFETLKTEYLTWLSSVNMEDRYPDEKVGHHFEPLSTFLTVNDRPELCELGRATII